MCQHYHNQHAGQTCIVIGNGLSLREVPGEFLQKYPTFGANRIYLRFVPTYYVCINPLVIEQNRAEIEALRCDKFVRAEMNLEGCQLKKSIRAAFSFFPLTWINEGYTVTYVSLQLAYWMGFSVVLLVGVDHRYQFEGEPNQIQYIPGDDPNHFTPYYFRYQKWQTPDLENSEKYYVQADAIYRQSGRRIFNLTQGSALNVFEKSEMSEWM
jgi:hypothetical protein